MAMSDGPQGRRSPAKTLQGLVAAPSPSSSSSSSGHGNTLAPIIPRSPSLRPSSVASPPLSPRLHQSAVHHNRSPSFSATLNVVDLLASQQPNGFKPLAREWTKIPLSELVEGQKLTFLDGDTPVEEACQTLVDQKLTSLLLRSSPDDKRVWRTFDYSDLTVFLLMVLGVTDPAQYSSKSSISFQDLVKKAREGDHNIPVRLVGDIGMKDPFITLPASDTLAQLVQIMASGVHRVAVAKDLTSSEVIGVLSQRKVVKFFWDNIRSFVDLEPIYQKSIGELGIGSTNVISISADARVLTALETMTFHGISSVAVIDPQKQLVGNISMFDVQYVARTSSAHLLRTTCAHFLSVIKFEQGLRDGQDQVPVFAVYPTTSLASTVAKLVATKAHRMWIVHGNNSEPPSPGPSGMSSVVPGSSPATAHVPASTAPHVGGLGVSSQSIGVPGPALAGRLQGVVSLTDILNLFARVEGLRPPEPTEARMNRRRSSSSSTATSTTSTSAASILDRRR